MQQIHSTSSSSADIPFPNIFNTHCGICSYPIAHSDINILQPCCCGPFHNYCITNLELQAREANQSNPSPHLQCPRCYFTVTAITFDFANQVPRSTRPPFTTSSNVLARPGRASSPIPCPKRSQLPSHLPPSHQAPSQPLLPTAIHDIRPASPPRHPDNQPWSPYPNPTTPIPLHYSPTHKPQHSVYHSFQESASFPPYPTYRPLSSQPLPPPPPPPPPIVPESSPYRSSHPPQAIPTAPPISEHEQVLPQDINDCFPPLSQDFKPHSTNKTYQSSAHVNRKRHVSNFAAESQTKGMEDHIDLPSPHNAVPPSPTRHKPRRRQQSHLADKTHPKTNSPNTIVIRRHVSEDEVRKGLYGDDVYKAYVEGTAKLLRESPSDVKQPTSSKNLKVKIEMEVHVYHHYKQRPAFPDVKNDRTSARDRERRKAKAAERSWWKSPRAVSLLDARERRYRERRSYA